MGLSDVIRRVKYGDIQLPTIARVPDHHVRLRDGFSATPFEANRHYFTVRANSMGLRHDREWFKTWQPMLVAVTEFRYGTAEMSVPFVMGPDTLRQRANVETPLATVFTGTRLAGTHPYVGDRVAVTVLLFKVLHTDYASRVLSIVDSLAAALDYSAMLAPYLKLAGAIRNGIDAILGSQKTMAVLGYRTEYNPNAGDVFRPGYYALAANALEPSELWVRDDHLLRAGPDAATAQPVSDDLVLYSITATDARNDVDSLPWCAPLWERVKRTAAEGTEKGWTRARAHLMALNEQLHLHPDIAEAQAKPLFDDYLARARSIRDEAILSDTWGPGDMIEDPLESESLRILTDG